jgi:tetratricopeptide (TPR) repeat protein
LPSELLHKKALEIYRRQLTDDNPATAKAYSNVAGNLNEMGRYAEAQPLYLKALEIRRRLLTEVHPDTALGHSNLALNLRAQGRYAEAREEWRLGLKSLDQIRQRVAFTGMERAGRVNQIRLGCAAVLARMDQPSEAWQALEEDLGRSLLDELAAQSDRRLPPGEQARLRDLTAALAWTKLTAS